jgi:hypothetical protein
VKYVVLEVLGKRRWNVAQCLVVVLVACRVYRIKSSLFAMEKCTSELFTMSDWHLQKKSSMAENIAVVG